MKLKKFEQLRLLGDSRKPSKKEAKQLAEVIDGGFECRKVLELSLGSFVDAERHLVELDYYSFCRIFVKKKWYKPIRISHMTAILLDFKTQKEEIKDTYRWVFDPPSYGKPAEESVGSQLRADFVLEFGNLVVLTDLLISKMGVSFREVETWSVEDFFFWANYYSSQKIVENVK